MADDEKVIGAGYQRWLAPVLVAIPLVAAYYLDIKWVMAISAAILIFMALESGGRQHDLCIRLRRTNLLLAEKNRAEK
ncbi:hypothetical protein [Mesorhizobium sp. 43Arga]